MRSAIILGALIIANYFSHVTANSAIERLTLPIMILLIVFVLGDIYELFFKK